MTTKTATEIMTEVEAALDELMKVCPPEQLEDACARANRFAETFKVPLRTALHVIRIRIIETGDPGTPTPYPYPETKE